MDLNLPALSAHTCIYSYVHKFELSLLEYIYYFSVSLFIYLPVCLSFCLPTHPLFLSESHSYLVQQLFSLTSTFTIFTFSVDT